MSSRKLAQRVVRDLLSTAIAEKVFCVYIMSNVKHGVLYVGVTSDLVTRVLQHREGAFDGFTKRYQLKRLVWYGVFDEALEAIAFEKKLKRWRRAWKFRLIEEMNPEWEDLWSALTGQDLIGPLSHLQGR